MTTKDVALIYNLIDEVDKLKEKLIDLVQAEEEDYLERTDNIKPVSVRLDEALETMKQCELEPPSSNGEEGN